MTCSPIATFPTRPGGRWKPTTRCGPGSTASLTCSPWSPTWSARKQRSRWRPDPKNRSTSARHAIGTATSPTTRASSCPPPPRGQAPARGRRPLRGHCGEGVKPVRLVDADHHVLVHPEAHPAVARLVTAERLVEPAQFGPPLSRLDVVGDPFDDQFAVVDPVAPVPVIGVPGAPFEIHGAQRGHPDT